jgi:hypothetical protein
LLLMKCVGLCEASVSYFAALKSDTVWSDVVLSVFTPTKYLLFTLLFTSYSSF